MMTNPRAAMGPTTGRERHVVLDALRGLALLGIALANFPEFGLWTFLSSEAQSLQPTAAADRIVRFLQYMLVDGKFYTIFSLLFGIGFALFLSRHSRGRFIRRMALLMLIGALHLMFIWSGDILLLYAIGGLPMTLFVRCKDRTLLCLAGTLILLPVGLDALTEFCGVDFAAPFYAAWWKEASAQGITEENFATWLRDADSYPQMFAFLSQGAYERIWEFVSGHRLPKVLGLFMLGYLMGKHRLYARLTELPLASFLRWCTLPALMVSGIYALSATNGQPWGLTLHSLLYAASVIPLALCYVAAFCLLFVKAAIEREPNHACMNSDEREQARQKGKDTERRRGSALFTMLAAPGRMALTNYISQSLSGILLFYGLGLGLGTGFGLIYIELTALIVFLVQILLSCLWLRHFRFGPMEWLWRICTYGRYYPIRASLKAVLPDRI